MQFIYIHFKVSSLWRALIISIIFSSSSFASSVKQVDVSELIEQSELVFEGRVLATLGQWNASETLITTLITFEVLDVLAGDYNKKKLKLRFVGGTVGTESIEAKGLRQPEVGEKGIYFVRSLSRNLVNPLVGWSQGQFLLEGNGFGSDVVMTDDHQPVIGFEESSSGVTKVARSKVISEGVATGVKLGKRKSGKYTAMTAVKFKKELRERVKKSNR